MATDPICGMKVDEKTGLALTHNGETYFFCAQHCYERFAKENGIAAHLRSCDRATTAKKWWKNKVLIVALLLFGAVFLSHFVPILEPFGHTFIMYARTIWWAILLGLIIGGMIDHYIPRSYISHILSRKRKRSIIYAVLLGFLMSACSHGILALAIQLYKKGASPASVVAFLLASPWANMALTIMLLGFFGIKGLFIIVAAIIIAIITGLIFQILEDHDLIEHNPHSLPVDASFSVIDDIKKRAKGYTFSRASLVRDLHGIAQGTVALSNMVLWWLLIGMGIASLTGAYIPADVFRSYMGPSFTGLFVTLGLATVIEVCSEGSAPLAFEIFRQTGALGNSFVFLMAGVVTDYTEIGLLWTNAGKKTALWLPIITVPQVILFGLLFNAIF